MHTSRPISRPISIRPRILLVNDPRRGGAIAKELTSRGYDVFYAKDTLEARWLWIPSFYDAVLVRLPTDRSGVTAFIERIRAQEPKQKIVLCGEGENEAENLPALNRSAQTVCVMPAPRGQGQSTAPSREAKIIEMPKRLA